MQTEDFLIKVIVMCPELMLAKSLAEGLVSQRLVACAQVDVNPIESTYWWKGEIHQNKEYQLVLKSTSSFFGKIQGFVLEHHPYETPELIATKIDLSLKGYEEWLRGELKS